MTTTLIRPMSPDASAAPPSPATDRPRWERPALTALLLTTAVAYLCNLSANGWANSFYAAAAQAGSVSWKAFLFGSSDAANAITVDKTPAALWPMDLAVRAFGLSSWTLLVPQVLMGVGAVAMLWATVRRPFGPVAGLLAGAVLAVTPVAALMFRFDNPDALLVLLMVAACWAMTRGLEDGRLRWLVLCGAIIGFGFLAKQLQVLLVVPALAITYLIAGPPRLGKRIAHLGAAAAAMVAAAGWWILLAELWPADSRPYFGGSQHNSVLELTFGYNGLGRLDGDEVGSLGSHGGGFWGESGMTRLFQPAQGGQIAWLLPAALILLVAAIVLRGRASRTDHQRAALVMWGGWLVVTALVFSFMRGIFHQYYTVALAPAIAALVGAGTTLLWRRRERPWVRAVAAVTMATTTATAWMLLSRNLEFVPWLRWLVLVGGIAVTVALLSPAPRRIAAALAIAAGLVGAAGPLSYTVDTLATAHTGPIPSAGPRMPMHVRAGTRMPWGQNSGAEGFGPGTHGGRAGGPAAGPWGRDNPGGNAMQVSTPSEKLTALLDRDGEAYEWVAATVSSNRAAGYQLATELPVMAIGGFNGSDPAPTLNQFRDHVAALDIHYFVDGADRGPGDGAADSTAARITAWVRHHFTAQNVDGVTIYDLTAPR
ncbi:glycosyl transferase [Nocardia nova]|nr:glycosyl transferase [Nocardia nova]